MIALLLSLAASAQTLDYAFATTSAHYGHWYPTAYYDHAGVDWNCGSIRYAGHRGSDFGAGSFAGMDAGRDITAAAHGLVIATHDGEFDRCTTGSCAGGGGFGNYVRVAHTDGKETVYAHLKAFSLTVSVGDVVECGQIVGQMGSSGYSTGPHLHFAVYNVAGNTADPFDGACSAPPSWWVDQGVYDQRPGLTCGTYPTCDQVQTLTCGDTVTSSNDGPGSTDRHEVHGCSQYVYSGPEIAYGITTPLNEPITVRITGLTADVDLYLGETDGCDGRGCLAGSHEPGTADEEVVFDASAGHVYTAVVDGWAGAVSGFTLSVECDGAPDDTDAPVDTSEPVDTDVSDTDRPDTGAPVDTSAPEGPASEPRVERSPRDMGCACASAPSPSAGWALLLLPLLLRRRR